MPRNPPPIQQSIIERSGVPTQPWVLWFQDRTNSISMESVIVVSSPSQLKGELDSSKIYLIDGSIDMKGQSIKVPPGGLFIRGLSASAASLFSSEDNYTMFTHDSTEGSGDIRLNEIGLTTSGTNSQLFDLDNENAGGVSEFSCVNVNFVDCTSLGTVKGYRQGLWEVIILLNCDDGITLDKEWAGGFRATTSIVVNFGSSGTVFSAGPDLLFNGRFVTDMNMTIPSGSTAIDFSPSNFASDNLFLIFDATFVGAGSFVPNTPPSDNVALFRSNTGIKNTYIGGRWEISTTATTTIASSGTLYKIAGTTTYYDLQHFTQTTDNAFIYDNEQTIEIFVSGHLSFTGNTGDEIEIVVRKYDNSASSYVDLEGASRITMNPSSRAENVAVLGYTELDQNDRIEIWVKNNSAANDVTAQLNGLISVQER